MTTKKFEERDVHVIREEQRGAHKIQIRIVRWCVDGKSMGTKLEKRRYFITEKNGQKKVIQGRLTGFTKQDMNYIHSNWSDISELFD